VKWLVGMADAGASLQKAAHIHDKQCRAVMKVLEDTLSGDGDLHGLDNIRCVVYALCIMWSGSRVCCICTLHNVVWFAWQGC